MGKIKPLRTSPIFNDLTDRELALFSKIVQEENYESETVLVAERMRSDAFYFIDSGKVAITVRGKGENDPLLLGPGDTFGEWALLVPGHLTNTTARVVEPSELLVIRSSDFDRLGKEEPAIALKVTNILIRRVWKSVSDVKEMLVGRL